jgi:energy-coupling factor transporter ATP-binding protein EcfA2
MFLLVTGASGAGKSTVRRAIAPVLGERIEAVELATLGITPEWSLSWRHRVLEQVVQRAIEADRDGRHFLLCGDPVPPGEVIATPSGDRLSAMHVCLLDVAPEAQRARLLSRGDDPELLPRHVAFAEWMRHHVRDPGHRPEVITGGGWEEMRWDRWVGAGGPRPWTTHEIDTTTLAPADVAAQVLAWIRTCPGEDR